MNYEEMSDFDINAVVTCIVHNCQGWEVNWTNSCFFHCGVDGSGYFSQSILNYCNNPNDAWPIIVGNGITIEFDDNSNFQNAYICNEEGYPEFEHGFDTDDCNENPLRAAMICFLKMKDAEAKNNQ